MRLGSRWRQNVDIVRRSRGVYRLRLSGFAGSMKRRSKRNVGGRKRMRYGWWQSADAGRRMRMRYGRGVYVWRLSVGDRKRRRHA